MSEPSETPEEPAPRKPFQYSLRSLFVITAILAIWLGIAKWSPAYAGFSLVITFVPTSYYFLVRWILRKDRKSAAPGCLLSLSLCAVPMFVFPALYGWKWQEGEMILNVAMWCVFALGVMSLPFSIYAFIDSMADRQDRREKAEASRKASKQSDPPL